MADGAYMRWDMLRVGQPITIYGRRFHLVGCNDSSRKYYKERAMPQPADQSYPEGPYDKLQKVWCTSNHPSSCAQSH